MLGYYLIKNGMTLTETVIRAVYVLTTEIIDKILNMGFTISLPFANFRTSIKGRFKSLLEVFNPEVHSVHCGVSLGTKLKEKISEGFELKLVKHFDKADAPGRRFASRGPQRRGRAERSPYFPAEPLHFNFFQVDFSQKSS